jgi:hypothetical protein
MPTVMHTLAEQPEEHRLLHEIYGGGFLHGECYAFALALYEGLGWPLVGLMNGAVIWHAGVRSPDGNIRDVRGSLSEAKFAEGFVSAPYRIIPIVQSDLYNTRPIDTRAIDMARRLAETIWPELPWRSTHANRVRAFVDELEELCRKHNLWIMHPLVTQLPRVAKGDELEDGYDVRPLDGSTFTIQRRFVR